MSKSRILSTVLAVAVACCSTGPARASLVTWEFAGHLTDVTDVAGVLPDTITVGTPFFGSYTFESETADTQPGNPLTGVYPAITFFDVDVGGIRFAGPNGPRSIVVGLPSPSSPRLVYGTNVGLQHEELLADGGIGLIADGNMVFQDDSLPVDPPSLALFDQTPFSLDSREKLFFLEGTVTSLVPEPVTLLLLTVGGMLVLRRTGRHHQIVAPAGARTSPPTSGFFAATLLPLLLSATSLAAIECQPYQPSNECDINCDWPRCHVTPCGDVADCNENRLSDACELPTCQPIEVVFLIDISYSVGTETPSVSELCDEITLALDSFAALAPADRSALIAYLRTLRTPTTSPQRNGR